MWRDASSPDGAKSSLLKMYSNWASSNGENSGPTNIVSAVDKVRATFVLGRAHLKRLKHLVTAQCLKGADSEPLRVSTFAVICAFIWVSLIKSQESVIKSLPNDDDGDGDKYYYFLFPFDC